MSRLIDADALEKAKFHPLPYTHIVPQDTDAESYKRGWNDAIDAIVEDEPTVSAEPQWTPIKKGYPTESGYYNVTIMGHLDDRLEPAVEYYSPNTARDKKRWKAINVIAWRPADVYRE